MMRLLVWSAAAGLLCTTACNSPSARLNAPPHGEPYETHEMQGTFTYMVDNALLADMTVSDMHFLPHRAQLSDLGMERLNRLASLIEAYGGTIRFNSDLEDRALIDQRLTTVCEYLAEAGMDTTSEIVKEDMPGGRGMDAGQVILIRKNEGAYKEKSSSSSSATAAPGGTPPLSQ